MSNISCSDSQGVSLPEQGPTLLVSVANEAEAMVAIANGAGWVDVKDPLAGSLGAPAPGTAARILLSLCNFPRRSIALGELGEVSKLTIPKLLEFGSLRYSITKIGLANTQSCEDWRTEFDRLATAVMPSQLIPVLYADFARCQGATPIDVIELVSNYRPPFLLIDTYIKDGQRLLDWFRPEELEKIQAAIAPFGTGLVLAGSLQLSDLPTLIDVQPAVIAVRGAVCNGDRTGSLCGHKVLEWSQAMRKLYLTAR